MKLMWQNGQVVVNSQNEEPLEETRIGEASIRSDQSPSRETGSEEENRTHQLFIQEDDMASWLHYPLENSPFDRDFCVDHLLYPTSCATITTTPPTIESPAKRHRNFEFLSRIASGLSSSTKAGRESK